VLRLARIPKRIAAGARSAEHVSAFGSDEARHYRSSCKHSAHRERMVG
jgi:hypothetical protein